VLAGAGHYLPLEQPAVFRAQTLAWLDATFGGRTGARANIGMLT
jgi:hypothetical protein